MSNSRAFVDSEETNKETRPEDNGKAEIFAQDRKPLCIINQFINTPKGERDIGQSFAPNYRNRVISRETFAFLQARRKLFNLRNLGINSTLGQLPQLYHHIIPRGLFGKCHKTTDTVPAQMVRRRSNLSTHSRIARLNVGELEGTCDRLGESPTKLCTLGIKIASIACQVLMRRGNDGKWVRN